jgi:hypothetical protein
MGKPSYFDVMGRVAVTFALVLVVGSATGCAPGKIVGPLSYQFEERQHLIDRARHAGVSTELIEKVAPPLTPSEWDLAEAQDSSCRSSYMWKNFLTYSGSVLVAGAAGLTIGGAYVTGNANADTTKQIFGVTGGSMALLGTLFVAIGGMVQNHFTDSGCVTKPEK